MKSVSRYLLIVLVAILFVGCNAPVKNKANTSYKKIQNLPPNIDELDKPFVMETSTIYSRKSIDSIILKEKKIDDEKALLQSLELLNAGEAIENQFTLYDLDQTLNGLVYDSATVLNDGGWAISKEIEKSFNGGNKYKVTYLLFYNKDKQLTRVVNFRGGNYGKLILSKDGTRGYAKGLDIFIDINNYKTIQDFTRGEIFVALVTNYQNYLKFAFSQKKDYFNVTQEYYWDEQKKWVYIPAIMQISTKKKIYSQYTQGDSPLSIAPLLDVSPNGKYIISNRSNLITNFNDTKIKYTKVLSPTNNEEVKTAWNDDLVFFKYITDSTNDQLLLSGVYDLQNDQVLCKDIENDMTYGNIKDVIWTQEDNHIYAIGSKSIYPFLFQNNECIRMNSYHHKIVDLEKSDFTFDFFNDNNTLTVFSKGKINSGIDTVELRKYTQKDISDSIVLKKINRLLDSGFEQRALKEYDDYLTQNPEWYQIAGIQPKKYRYAYDAYAAARQFNKFLNTSDEIFDKFLFSYRAFCAFASWYHYEDLIQEANKRFRNAIRTKPMYDEILVKKILVLMEATYLLHINKDQEAYNMLFDNQPFDHKDVKEFIKSLTLCQTALSKDMDKLAVALDLQKSDLGDNLDCELAEEYPFFFDIDGNKIYREDLNKQLLPQSNNVIEETKEENNSSDALMLLD